MIKQLINIYQKIENKERWMEQQVEKCSYIKKRETLLENVENAKKYNDFLAIQEFSAELIWLMTIRKYDYEKEVVSIRQAEDFFYWADKPLYELNKGLDSKKILNNIYLSYKEADLLLPTTLDLNNEKHQSFAVYVAEDFETAYRNTKFEGLASIEKNLPFSRQFIFNTLTFCSLFCTYKKNYMDKEYMLELRSHLENFL